MEDFRLDGPWAEADCVNLLLHGDGQVLMPGDLPIRPGDLVEEDAAHGKEQKSKNWLHQSAEQFGMGQRAYLGRYIQEIADGENPAALSCGRNVFYLPKRKDKVLDKLIG